MPAQKIILIRHGEKQVVPPPFGVTEDGDQDKHSLSVRGWERAGALVPFFRSPWASGILTPSARYASNVSSQKTLVDGEDVAKSLRPQQTLTPLSLALSLDINIDWTVGQEAQLADAISANSGIVLVAWEHKHIPLIASALSDQAPTSWPGGDRFDIVWVLDPIASGKYSFRQISQSLLGGDQP